jgi:hypothetical protein
VALADGKPIAIGEAAPPPNVDVLASQTQWTWFMPWGNRVLWGNGIDIFKDLFASGKALAKEDMVIENGVYRLNQKE